MLFKNKEKITPSANLSEKNLSEAGLLRLILENQLVIIKHLEAVEQNLEAIAKSYNKSSKTMNQFSKAFAAILGNQKVFYQKFLLTRLNMMEISEGKPVSISRNEQIELENSRSEKPNPEITVLPELNLSARLKNKYH
jgi:hypothetical protein